MQHLTKRALYTLPPFGTVLRLDVGIPLLGPSLCALSAHAARGRRSRVFSHLRLALFGWLSVSLLFS